MTQLNEYQKEITTPIQKDRVVVKTILTRGEQEAINGAQMKYVDGSVNDKGEVDGKLTDVAGAMNAELHALLKASIVSINDDSTNCFDRVQKMYEPDAKHIEDTIREEQKKAWGDETSSS